MKVIELFFNKENAGAGVTAISLVDRPAILVDWVAFSDNQNQKNIQFKFADEDKRIILGPVMIPEMNIARVDKDGNEFEVFYSAETVNELSQHFLKTGKQTSATLEHEHTLNGITVVESWLIEDPAKDKSAAYGFNLPKGTWMVSMHVEDDDIWQGIKDDKLKGFSIEAYLENKVIKNSIVDELQKTMDMLKSKIADISRQVFGEQQAPEVETKTSKDEKQTDMGSVAVTDADGNAVELIFAGDAIEVGTGVNLMIEGEEVAAPDGDYMADGQVYVVVDGAVAEVKAEAVEEVAEVEQAEAPTDDNLKKQIVEILEKFSVSIEETIDSKINAFQTKMEQTPGAESIKDTPTEMSIPEKESWKAYVKRKKLK